MIMTVLSSLLLGIVVGMSQERDMFPSESVTGAVWAPRAVEPLRPAEPFEAFWIGPPAGISVDPLGGVFEARREVEVKDPSLWQAVRVSADSACVLWVNGVEVFRGPALFDPAHQVYETLDLSSFVQAGTNAVAARVICWSDPTTAGPYRQVSAMPGFLLDSPELKTDKTWRVRVCPGYRNAGRENTRGGGAAHWYEWVEGAGLSKGLSVPGFQESSDWTAARIISRAERWNVPSGDTGSPWKLYPRTILPPFLGSVETVIPAQSGAVLDTSPQPPYAFAVAPDAAEYAVSTLPVVFPGDGKVHYAVFDAGELVNAWVSLEVEGATGTAVEVMWAEAPSLEGEKGRRDQLEHRRIEGSADVYVLKGNGPERYEPMSWRTFRFIRVAARCDAPVSIRALQFRRVGYPFQDRGRFSCDDPFLNRVWDVGRNTQRLCAVDTFQDCPYYERLQYGGDTRIQCLVTYAAFGDTLLPANAIRQLQASVTPEGLIQSRYPNHVFQVIPGYSLAWIQMLDDFLLYTGDTRVVADAIHVVDSILRFYHRHLTDAGFIAGLPYWNFYDWTFEQDGVPAAHAENDTLATLHYKLALDAAARLHDALGESLEAERFKAEARTVADAVNSKAWDDREGLYRDGIATQTFSRHVNAFAILADVADPRQLQRIAERLFTDSTLRGTTFYFAHYLHDAAEKLDLPGRILEDLKRWKPMLDAGSTTWWETPDGPRSECHAWSATPTYRLPRLILGIRPVQPGWRVVEIRPWPGPLRRAEGAWPTPLGDVSVAWRREQGRFFIKVSIPEGMSGEVVLPDGTHQGVTSGTRLFSCPDPPQAQ